VRADEMAMVPWTDEQKTAFVRSQFEAQHHHYLTSYPDGQFLKVELDGEPVGRLYQAEMDDHFHVIEFSILPEFRGRGIGTTILSDILSKSVKPVRIYLETFNKWVGLFERLGFVIIEGDGLYNLWEAPGRAESTSGATA
jgi:GNAT superfamily N-acetyltransferase